MIQTTVAVDGMMCGMCEAHINDAVRNHFQVKKVTSSRGAGKTVILTEGPIDEAALRRVIEETGYTPGDITTETVEKKKFSLFRKK